MDERSEVVRRALDYPYAIPKRSFVQVGERSVALGEVEVDLAQRTALRPDRDFETFVAECAAGAVSLRDFA